MPVIPPIDTRSREELFEEMRKSFKEKGIDVNEGDGEILSVLTALYSNMLEDTIKRLNQTPEKHRAAFLNITHTPPRPAWPSSGIVAFEVAGGYDNPVEISKDTRVAADVKGEPISFKLNSDLTALPANITDIYWFDASRGRYGFTNALSGFSPWDEESTMQTAYKADFIFANIFSNNIAAAMIIEAELDSQPISLVDLSYAADWSISAWPCGEDNGNLFQELQIKQFCDGYLSVKIDAPFANAECIRLRMELKKSGYEKLIIRKLNLKQLSGSAAPSAVLTSSRGLAPSSFYPFGFPMNAFEECGIFCGDALSQKYSKITLRFNLKLEATEEWPPNAREAVDFKWIMRKPPPKPEPVVYKAFAKSVRLEYWDGSTYREIRDELGRKLDFTQQDAQVELIFDCPEDIVPCEYYGAAGYFLRLSCGACDELYMLPRRVFTPRISEVEFSYSHTDTYYCIKVMTESFGKKRETTLSPYGIAPFELPEQSKSLLLGFDRLSWKCRMKMYVNIENSKKRDGKAVKIDAKIYSADGGADLTAFDRTEALTASGALWLEIPENAQSAVLFGKERYWVSIPAAADASPVISGIYLNAVTAENKISYEENFSYSALKNRRITLSHKNIIRASVYVRSLTGVEMEPWCEYGARGGKFRSGFYKIDYVSGMITFPTDIIGRRVNEDMLDLIRVVYQATDGDNANLPANSITRTEQDIPFVQSVRNPMAVAGGEKGESGEELAARKRHMLYNGGSIVTKRDFELFAIDNCPLVSDAKCIFDSCKQTVMLNVLIHKDSQNAVFGRIKRTLLRLFEGLIPSGMRLDIVPWEDYS